MTRLAGYVKWKIKFAAAGVLAIALLLSAGLPVASAQESDDQSMAVVKQSIQESLQLEKELLARLEQEREQVRQLEPTLAIELEDYRVLHTTYTNMLAQQMPDPSALEQADTHVKAALIRIRERLEAFNKRFDTIGPLRSGLNEQLTINAAYLKEVRKTRKKPAEDATFIQHLEALVDVIGQKRQHLDKLYDFYFSSITKMGGIQENLLSLSAKLGARISKSRKTSRLIRQTNLLAPDGLATLKKETDALFEQMERLLSLPYLTNEFSLVWKSGSSFMALPVLLFLLVMTLALRLRRNYSKILEKPAFENAPVFRLVWQVFNRSVFLLVIIAFLFIYTQAKALYVPVHVVILLSLLQIYLFTKWGLNIVSGASRIDGINIQPALQKRLRALLILIRCYMMFYIVMSHLSQSGSMSMLLTWARLLFEVMLTAWCLEYWRTNRRLPSPAVLTRNEIFRKEAIRLLTYLISLGGLAFEITGYGSMAFFWFASWGRTLVIGLWAILLYGALQELSGIYQVDPADKDKDIAEASSAPVTWLFLKLGQPVVLVFFLVAVILAWGGKGAFLVGLLKALQGTYRIGSLEFSIIGFIYALVALLITHIIAQSWRHFFQHKLLSRSGMVVGLQESLTTISIYVLWVMGVLIALNLLGMNTTTLTVAFGALGIGLGFGLQNIFNNFVSGIILLLERPIQVGDDIQINDTWATVRKINVRSTIVQTYDNASLIIPNSDLISNQVINWSFQDKRLRRNILVGVAYGSDIELVRQTLLEVAATVPRVLKQPKPDVIFKDFGDSALIFNLRIWTHIAFYLSVETEVRFAIDRLFRERNISIAFPQRDIHVYHENPPTPVAD